MDKLKNKLLAHKIITGFVLMLVVVIVGVEAAAYTSQNEAPNTVFEGDCVSCDLSKNITENVEQELGAFPGPDVYSDINIYGNLAYGGGAYIASTTTATTYTVVQKDLQPYSYIDLMVNTGATTLTLPATSTMNVLLPYIGMTREWLFHNATSSSGITLTLAAGGGMDLIAVTSNDDVIDPGEWTRLTCARIYYRSADNENIMCIVDELANAD